jgi:methylated-DNA-[protein]-cysteine S-methyltransferase
MKTSDSTLYWSLLEFEKWKVYLAATSKGLCFVGSQNKPFDELVEWAKKRFPGYSFIEEEEKLQNYKDQIIEYFEGKRTIFTFDVDFHGTPFQLEVWNTLCGIPFGETTSYSAIANSINKPAAVRAVGTAIGANPILISIPCHRVVGKNGALTGYRGGLEMKTKLLELEKK